MKQKRELKKTIMVLMVIALLSIMFIPVATALSNDCGFFCKIGNFFSTLFKPVATGAVVVSDTTPGLVAIYHMDEAAGATTIADSSGNGNTGTLVNGVVSGVAGQFGNALSFDGVNDYVDLSSIPSQTPPLTIEMWVKPDVNNPVGMFDSSPNKPNTIRNYPAGYVKWWGNTPRVALNLVAGEWAHLVFIFRYDGYRHVDYYKNGVLQTSVTGDTDPSLGWYGFTVGNINGGTAGWYGGLMDEPAIYNRALTATEVADHASVTVCGNNIVETGEQCDDGNTVSGDCCSSTCQIETAATGAVSLWHAENNANDAIDTNDGTLMNGATFAAGKVGNALSFDGVNDYVSVADSPSLSFGNGLTDSPFSIEAWIKPVDITRFRLLNKYDGTNYEWALSFGGTDILSFTIYDATGSNRIDRRTSNAWTFLEGSWHHVAATYDGSGSSTGLSLYIDGVRVDDTTANAGTYIAMHDFAMPIHIGGEFSTFANGLIDEPAIYNTALSAATIQQHYNAGANGYCGATAVVCGNNIVETGEQCDGTDLAGQTCTTVGSYTGGTLACTPSCTFDTSSCTTPAVCGNNIVEAGEQCDDGNLINGDGCSSTCVTEYCGDGIINNINEVCDGSNLGGQDCTTQGYTGGTLACAAGCLSFDTTSCTSPPQGILGDLNNDGNVTAVDLQKLINIILGR